MKNRGDTTYLVYGAKGVNIPRPELGEKLSALFSSIEQTNNEENDPAFEAYKTQVLGHLQHVSFDFRVATDSPDYVHAPVIEAPYPVEPTKRQIHKAEVFTTITDSEATEAITPFGTEDVDLLERLRQTQFEVDKSIIQNPDAHYADFKQRLDQDGFAAEFPEFASTLQFLSERILNGNDIKVACQASAILTKLREKALVTLAEAQFGEDQQSKTPQYHEGIFAVETALEFLDVLQRSLGDSPGLYHSGRYEYYLHFLVGQPDHITYPTISNTGATDLLKLRHVPIGVAGVTTEITYVDGFPQTSYEFFHHDINHSRRMYQFYKEKAVELGITPSELSETGGNLMASQLLPAIKILPDDSEQERQLKRTARMLLFEITHEDALPVDAQTLLAAMFRQPLTRTPFEQILDNRTVEYFMEAGATTLAYTYRKLAHTFYDTPGHRMNVLGDESLRGRYVVVEAAMRLFKALGGNGLRDEQAIEQFEQLVSTDEGFPEAFFETVKDDIDARKSGKNGDFGFYVALPKNAEETVQAIKHVGKRVVTLFGYSDLGYARPDLLLEQIGEDLQAYDPSDTVVVIGATEAGIGQAYPIAANLGFETASIVSTKVLAHDGKFSSNAGDIHLVRDSQWGGYLPGTRDMSPTTEAFVRSANEIIAYGGGTNTAVALLEAKRRGGVALKYRQHAMSEESQSGQPYGEAFRVWSSDIE